MKKTTKKTSKKISKAKPSALKTVKKPSLIEEIKITKPVAPKTSVVKRIPIELCMEMFDLLQYTFQPEGFYDDEDEFYADDRFLAMWKSYLIIAGFPSEDLYWQEVDALPVEKCEKCKEDDEKEQKKLAEEKAKNVN